MEKELPDKNGSMHSEIILLNDSQWVLIDGKICRATEFFPIATVKNGKAYSSNKATPYASFRLECRGLPQMATAYAAHKIDFLHLWLAFRERLLQQDEEVLIFWSKQHYRGWASLLSAFFPRMWVMVCPKGAFELLADPNHRPELTGEARWNAQRAIVEWKPAIMK
ncbi:MAG: hypothetical protein PHR28_09715 [candidate division Zixibacteria bacterium]|nr:hypothetical protein [candidate division Zixibacteria bacterium]